jgi:hypothetical protein
MNQRNLAKGTSTALLQTDGEDPAFLLGQANTQKLVQELQLHKIELEMQNEELQRIQVELKASWRQVDHLVVERTTELTRAMESLAEEVRQRYQAEGALRAAYGEIERLKNRLLAENAELRQALEERSGSLAP